MPARVAADVDDTNAPKRSSLGALGRRDLETSSAAPTTRDVVFVSKQLGHSSPAVTLGVYSHLFDHRRSAEATRQALARGDLAASLLSFGDG